MSQVILEAAASLEWAHVTGCGCGGALDVGSLCCAWGIGERTGVLSSFCLSDEGACVVGRAAR